jgi:hypothetical protein
VAGGESGVPLKLGLFRRKDRCGLGRILRNEATRNPLRLGSFRASAQASGTAISRGPVVQPPLQYLLWAGTAGRVGSYLIAESGAQKLGSFWPVLAYIRYFFARLQQIAVNGDTLAEAVLERIPEWGARAAGTLRNFLPPHFGPGAYPRL